MRSLTILVVIALNLSIFVQASKLKEACGTESSTVCGLRNGTQACCPVKDATCCNSGEYCCPKGFQCDINGGRCVKDEYFIPFYLKLKPLSGDVKLGGDILCPVSFINI